MIIFILLALTTTSPITTEVGAFKKLQLGADVFMVTSEVSDSSGQYIFTAPQQPTQVRNLVRRIPQASPVPIGTAE